MMDASSDDENEEGFDVVPVVEADGNTDLTDLLEQALVPRMAVCCNVQCFRLFWLCLICACH